MTTPLFERFLLLSVDLTAFEETDLLGTGMAHHYLAKVRAACGDEVVTALLDAHRAARADAAGAAGSVGNHARTPLDRELLDRDPVNRDSIDRDLFDRALRHRIFSDDRLGPVARNVVKLWYAGLWYALPAEWIDRYGAHTAAETSTVTVGAYQEGLLWRAIGANPPGAKAPGYGSWAQPPRIADRYLKGATK